MNKEDFKKYKGLPRERDYLTQRLQKLEKDAENVPTVKTKVQSSAKEYPYVQTHVTVDAPHPARYTAIMNDIRRKRRRLANVEHLLDDLEDNLAMLDDARARQILTARYVDGMKVKDIAARFDLTDQHVIRIINETVKKL